MKKAVIAAATAALIAGSAIAHAAGPADVAAPSGAQTAAPQAAAPSATPQGGPQKDAAQLDTRIAALKDGLKLTPDQEKLWPAFETALRGVVQERTTRVADRRAERQAAQPGERRERPDPVTRMRAAADRLTANAGELRTLADALDPLYKSFDAAQKKRFEESVRKDLGSFFGMSHPPRGDRPRRG
ncbi:Spy/CpxP family protein refolding chaperone [Xanthobacter sp. V4C-4]|uniref:Spy/CpxP family protein refolding chaperone n=1 Tax=Xanthobacter cornucopiae TaxID=3119924 RepID=UPI00372C67F2